MVSVHSLTQDSRNARNRSRTRKNPVFLIYSSRFLDGFERLSAEATFRTPAHTAKMQPLLAGYMYECGVQTTAKFAIIFVYRHNKKLAVNPLSPNIHIQILKTDLHTFSLRISGENLIKDHGISSMVIILLILITLSVDSVWMLLGENCCWSLLALKGLSHSVSL